MGSMLMIMGLMALAVMTMIMITATDMQNVRDTSTITDMTMPKNLARN